MRELKYKDACDNCKQFDYCRGVNGQVLCPQCEAALNKEEEQQDGNQSEETK